ncbi:DUF885 domain-containing protein [Stackebrandtia nassauensis]|uniref:DUF885 domain-containing protein n=1 Tax=Stackebrandtia nassauensis (strain DSM 44728 / CIP 108903 / NRRL B-16338 / NBRC 102104 / LLR-40K-21) TaxID=446470 RepID=D3Q253_STANL|nr:DUF885 domain-containing protein [Stackebrandtia nassauensis]ADD41920.1 protein of unknown function DUF885 [Stackebrandtia nassauensis DSM 44728]
MAKIDDIAERYMEKVVELSPIRATYMGVKGLDHEYDDFTVEGFAEKGELDRSTLAAVEAAQPASEAERVAKEAMVERLRILVERYEAGDLASGLSVIFSPMHSVRSSLDLMGTEGTENLENIAERMSKVGGALRDYAQTLRVEAARGNISARRQITECAKHADNWNGAAGDDFWEGLLGRLTVDGRPVSGALAEKLTESARSARAGLAEFGKFLRQELAPLAPEADAVGRDKYSRGSRFFLGSAVDLQETYEWGWQELHRIETEMAAVANEIKPGATVDEAIAVLDAQEHRNLSSKEAFREWMQELADATIADMADRHFDIPEPIRRIECMIAPTSDGTVYYTGPSEDFERPGRMWWSVPPSQQTFSTWRQVTTVYHEGVPGHHLQIGQTAYRTDILNRYQRRGIHCSGHSEGWALYSERLMDELGYLSDPGDKLGMLDGQAFRATRVVIDIGMHLQLRIPEDNPFGFHPGRTWTPELGWEFLTDHCRENHDFLRFELNRYLGWPGQAPSYKVGERLWLAAREEYKHRKGSDFDLKTFHTDALNLGTMGLDPFAAAMRRL